MELLNLIIKFLISTTPTLSGSFSDLTQKKFQFTCAKINYSNLDDTNNEILISEVLTPGSSNQLESFWTIINIKKHPNAIVEVFNRYGQRVFSKTNYQNNWQGDFKGSRLPAGSYYYHIYLPDSDKTHRGWIFLTY